MMDIEEVKARVKEKEEAAAKATESLMAWRGQLAQGLGETEADALMVKAVARIMLKRLNNPVKAEHAFHLAMVDAVLSNMSIPPSILEAIANGDPVVVDGDGTLRPPTPDELEELKKAQAEAEAERMLRMTGGRPIPEC